MKQQKCKILFLNDKKNTLMCINTRFIRCLRYECKYKKYKIIYKNVFIAWNKQCDRIQRCYFLVKSWRKAFLPLKNTDLNHVIHKLHIYNIKSWLKKSPTTSAHILVRTWNKETILYLITITLLLFHVYMYCNTNVFHNKLCFQ